MKGMIIVFSGPSGAGKGRIADEIIKRRKNVRKVLSVTTRPKREEDFSKNNYLFYSEELFLDMKSEGKFFETNFYDGHWYGTLNIPEDELVKRDLIFDKDVNGAIAIKKEFPYALTFYIIPKDNDTLLKRRGERGEDRSAIAISEVPKAKELDFLIINDNIEDAVNEVESIIGIMRKCLMKNQWNQEFMDDFY